MTFRKWSRLILSFLLTALFLWLVVRNLSFEDFFRALKEAEIIWIAAALLSFFIGYACRIARWRLMLSKSNSNLLWITCVGPMFASVAANNVLPLRAGDVLRAFGFNKRLGISASTSVTTLFIERGLDLLVIICTLGVLLWLFDLKASSLIGLGGLTVSLIAATILVILMFPNVRAPLILCVEYLVRRVMPNAAVKVSNQIRQANELLQHLSSRGQMARLIGWSLVAWMAEGCVFWFSALALPSISQPFAAWLALVVGTLSTVVPSTPGFIGTFDYFVAQAMILLGNSLPASSAYVFLVHALLWLPPTVVGGIYFFLYPVDRNISRN